MPPPKRCRNCAEPPRKAQAIWVPFYKHKIDGMHIRGSIPTLCNECAMQKMSVSSTDIVGVLTQSYASKYESVCNNKHWTELRENGLTIISDRDLSSEMHSLAEGSLYRELSKKKKSDELRHNTTPAMTRTISTGKQTKERGDFHDQRRWVHLYPNPTGAQTNSSLANQMLPIQTYLSETLFTHEHFALMAKRGRKTHLWHGRQNELQNFQQLLNLMDINVLIKGSSLNQPQSLHVDGFGLKVVVIYVDKCNEDDDAGYEFYYIKGSHRLLDSHHEHATNSQLPMKEVTKVILRPGDCIVFFESLLHGGGASSSINPVPDEAALKDTERYNRLGLKAFHWFGRSISATTMLPTDISFQMTFDFVGCPSSYSVPNRSNKWYQHTDALFENECCLVCDDLFSQSFETILWGECKHPIHKRCLYQSQSHKQEAKVICPSCKPKREWIEDSSGRDYMALIEKLQGEGEVERKLEKGTRDFIASLQTGQRISCKRNRSNTDR